MKERVAPLVGPRARAMWVSRSTRCACASCGPRPAAGAESSFSIYDAGRLDAADDDGRAATSTSTPSAIRPRPGRQVSNLKNELIDEDGSAARPPAARRCSPRPTSATSSRLRRGARPGLRRPDHEHGQLLQVFPDVAEHYRRRFRHVLVDEYQDTNHAQYVLVRELVAGAVTCRGPTLRRRRRRPVDLRLPRRDDPQHPRVRARLPDARRSCWSRTTAPPSGSSRPPTR